MAGFIFIGILSRLLPHPPNFTSLPAIALFSAWYLGNVRLSLFVVFATTFLSDFILGSHTTVPFTYLSWGLLTYLGSKLYSEKSFHLLSLYCITSSLLFFLISNGGVWATSSIYPITFNGLILCYIAALPFLLNQIVGNLIYGLIFWGYFSLRPAIQKSTLRF